MAAPVGPGAMTDLRQELGRQIPYLRRYARAITGVRSAVTRMCERRLERLLGIDTPIEPDEVRIALFAPSHDSLGEPRPSNQPPADPDRRLADSTILASRLHHLDPRKRHVLVLTSLEGLPLDQAASVMRLTTREAAELLEDAKVDLRSQQATRILIIEDEPVIALDIASTVRRNGHSVVGIATTHDEAVAAGPARAARARSWPTSSSPTTAPASMRSRTSCGRTRFR